MSVWPSDSVEARLRAVIESSPSGLLMTDAEGRIALVNREIERLFGYPREELLGQPVHVLVPLHLRDRHPAYREHFLRDPRVRPMGAGRELSGRRRDGTEVPVEIGLTPLPTEAGLFVVASVVDITARRQAEEERRQLEELLQQAQKLQALGTLAAGIAHDFNNVLAMILGHTEALRDATSNPQATADLHAIEAAALRGRDVVERILVFSRRKAPEMRPLELLGLLGDAAKLLRVNLPPSIELRTSVADSTPTILGDHNALHQLVVNLGNNAIHAMPDGGVLELTGEIIVVHDDATRPHPDAKPGRYACIGVRDTGQGIPDALLARVFEPFFTTKEVGVGTGLGLAIVHGIVRAHGGVVLLESRVGEGTRVRCLIPEATEQEAPGVVATPVQCGRGERVLLIDDEPALCSIGARRLTQLGYRVDGFTSGIEALAALQAADPPYEIVVTDHLMPSITGLQLATKVAELRPETLVLMVTGSFGDISEEQLRIHHVHRLLHKPVRTPQLAETLRAMLDARSA